MDIKLAENLRLSFSTDMVVLFCLAVLRFPASKNACSETKKGGKEHYTWFSKSEMVLFSIMRVLTDR